MSKKKYDFSGYATKNDLKCSDGRVILQDAFKHQDGKTVPLVWQHFHNDPSNILGHATLENRKNGVYCYCSFNDSENGQNAKEAVAHGDISFLSIYANQLKEQDKKVTYGNIKEVSLVLSGANPGAVIDNVVIQHADGTYSDAVEDEALIYTGLEIEHGEVDSASEDATDGEKKTVTEIFNTLNDEQKAAVNTIIAHAKGAKDAIEHAQNDATVKEVFDTLTDIQQRVVYYVIGSALKAKTAGSKEAKHSNLDEEGEKVMKHNVFDQGTDNTKKNAFTPEQLKSIVADVGKHGGSLKQSFLAHAEEYGFDPIDILFPDAKDTNPGGPVTIQRNTTWVGKVLGKTKHTPFSRIRTRIADLTAEEARAKGYVTGNLKKEQVVTLLRRLTTPTTIYKKQKLDRDDMIDITDFDVVVWLKNEMRGMLDEEIARAVLIGDGRSSADEDKINEQNVRPIATDDPNVFVVRVQVEADETTDDIIDEFIRARKDYKGSGTPDLYISTDLLTEMLLLKDQFGHRLYKTVQELASVLRVGEIIEVEPMNTAVRVSGDDEFAILGIVVNLADYTIGADKGGQVAMFDDFDIDYNQYKYLIETRISGALTLPKSAIVVERKPV
jgi:hypothetical protein